MRLMFNRMLCWWRGHCKHTTCVMGHTYIVRCSCCGKHIRSIVVGRS